MKIIPQIFSITRRKNLSPLGHPWSHLLRKNIHTFSYLKCKSLNIHKIISRRVILNHFLNIGCKIIFRRTLLLIKNKFFSYKSFTNTKISRFLWFNDFDCQDVYKDFFYRNFTYFRSLLALRIEVWRLIWDFDKWALCASSAF